MATNLVKEAMQKHIPNIFLLKKSEPRWKDIEVLIDSVYQERKAKKEMGEEIIIVNQLHYNFFDVLHLAETGDLLSLSMLEYFNIVFGELIKKISQEYRHRLGKTIDKILQTPMPNYIDHIGELLVLDAILSTGMFKLIGVEERIGDRKFADFCFEEIKTGEKYYVEVYNRHITEGNSDVAKLRDKLLEKKEDKTQNMNDINFKIVPVLWPEKFEDLKQLEDEIRKWEGFEIEQIFEPFAFHVVFEKDKPSYRFWRISNIYKNRKTK